MAISDYSIVTLLMFLLGGGGSDLLDHLPTDAYWQVKEVQVTPESLMAELKPPGAADVEALIEQLASPDAAVRTAAATKIKAAGEGAIPALKEETESEDLEVAQQAKSLIGEITAALKPSSVRRLMAIRTLGERKERGALDVLRPLLESKEPFVADYARVAIARVEGKPAVSTLQPAPIRQDLWLLPSGCAAVGQLVPKAGMVERFDLALAKMHLNEAQRKDRLDELMRISLELAETLGNARVDGVTVGVSGDLGDKSGYLVAILRGQFDRVAVAELVKKEGMSAADVEGLTVFQPDNESAMFFASDNVAVFMSAPAGKALPTREMIAAVRDGKGTLKDAKDLLPLVEKAPKDEAFWAVGRAGPVFQMLPGLGGAETFSLVGKQQGPRLDLTLTADGADAAKLTESVERFKFWQKGAVKAMGDLSPVMPPLKPVTDLLRSIKSQVQGNRATVNATFTGPVTGIILFMNHPYALAKPVEEPAEGKK